MKKTILALLVTVFTLPTMAQDLDKTVVRNARMLLNTLRLEAEGMSNQDLRKINQLIEEAMNIVDGVPTSTFTCSYTWNWNGPKALDMGPHTFYGAGATEEEAFNNLIAECIVSDIHLTTVHMCKNSIKPSQTFCMESK